MSDLIPNSSSSTSLNIELVVNEKDGPPLTERKSLGNNCLKKCIPSLPPRARRRICLFLHVVLVLFHISRLVVALYKQEQNVTLDIQDTFETLTARLSLGLQAFVTIYTAILVAMLQSLSLRNELCRLQTLTATNDKTRAWSGLGSAVYILWQQLFIYTSKGTFAITAYLTLITVLHNTTPALMALELFNVTTEVRASTIGGFPDSGDDLTMGIINTATFIPFLGAASNLTYLGLYNNTLYEVLQQPGVGRAVVNATTFEVSCGVINNLNDPARFGIGSYWTLKNDTYGAYLIPRGILRTAQLFGDYGRCYLYASTNVTDSEGTAGPQVSLSPPMRPEHNPLGDGLPQVFPMVDTLSVFGCSLSRISQKAIIDAATNLVISLDKPSWKNSSKWQEWEEPTEKSDFWTFMVSNSPPARLVPPITCGNCNSPSLIDEYLMSKLGLLVKNGTHRSLSFKSVLLHDVENSSAVWAAAQFESPEGTVGQTLFPGGTTTIQRSRIRARFKINLTMVVIGTGASILLVVLAFFLSRTAETHETAVDTIGVLELLWVYSKNRRETFEFMNEIDEPTIDNLRKAGLVEMRLLESD